MTWQSKKLGNIATFVNGKAFKPSDWSDSGLPIIRIQNLTNSIDDIHYYNGAIEDKYLIATGDILISWSATIGVFEWLNGDAVLNQHIFKVVFDKEPIDKTFFKHLIKQKIDEMLKNVHGSTMKHITKGDFDNIDVLLPSLDEQKKIAKILDKADEIRAKKKLANDKLDEFLKSTFISMFGDPVRNEQKLPKQALCSLCNKITDGTHDTPPRYDSGVMIITGKNIRPFKIDYSQLDYVTEADHKIIYERCNPEYGDVLYTNIGVNLGTAVMNNIHEEFSMKNVALLKNKREVLNSRFLEHILNFNTTKSEIIRISSLGGAQKFLSLQQIRNFEIIVPPIEDQNKFAQIVEHVEAQKQKNELVIEQMNNLFNSLSQRAFKGKLDT